MDSSLGPNAAKLALVESILRQLGQRWSLPRLKFGGFVQRGGAQVRCATGQVFLDETVLERLSAATLEVMMAHEAGHLRSHQRRKGPRCLGWWLDQALVAAWLAAIGALLGGHAAWALGLSGTAALGLVVAWPREPSVRERLEEEIRADAFACLHLDSLLAWGRAVRQYEVSSGEVARKSAQLALRRAALQELHARGLLRQVGMYPEREFPDLACWPRKTKTEPSLASAPRPG